jgi:hypothetical protein
MDTGLPIPGTVLSRLSRTWRFSTKNPDNTMAVIPVIGVERDFGCCGAPQSPKSTRLTFVVEVVCSVAKLPDPGPEASRQLHRWEFDGNGRENLVGKWESDRISRKPAPGLGWPHGDLRVSPPVRTRVCCPPRASPIRSSVSARILASSLDAATSRPTLTPGRPRDRVRVASEGGHGPEDLPVGRERPDDRAAAGRAHVGAGFAPSDHPLAVHQEQPGVLVGQ